jgi:hypothetical protein
MQFGPFHYQDFFLPSADYGSNEQILFKYQLENNPYLLRFYEKLGRYHSNDIFFYPISIFKDAALFSNIKPESNRLYFTSSGTTGSNTAYHIVPNPDIYRISIRSGFDFAFPNIDKTRILALLPSYLERTHASLVWMVEDLIAYKGLPGSGFYLHDFDKLKFDIEASIRSNEPLFIIGVTYALLDFFDTYAIHLPSDTVLMETGGMKGRRVEWVRPEVHSFLLERSMLKTIYSEYGMTELLSQAYSSGDGRFKCPPWMKVYIRDINDVFLPVSEGKSGRICIVDLANVHSCSHIATDDIGRIYEDGSFEVLGRADAASMRGCSLLYAESE